MANQSFSGFDLPAISSDAPLPDGRQFYGAVRGQWQEYGLTFAELIHSAKRVVPPHTHETPYYSLALAGHYQESNQRQSTHFGPFTAAFNSEGRSNPQMVAARNGVLTFRIQTQPSNH
jgi:hypothetical protein